MNPCAPADCGAKGAIMAVRTPSITTRIIAKMTTTVAAYKISSCLSVPKTKAREIEVLEREWEKQREKIDLSV